ncbi:MAG: hypothetical protein U0V56_07260 [Actinomycetota bacterium]
MATVVVGQLWGARRPSMPTSEERMTIVWWLLAFQVVSFLLSFAIWWMAPRDR